jgi:membrane protein required for colicin V production
MAGLTFLDVIVLLALGAGLVTGIMRGFVQEILSLGALILALMALRLGHTPLTNALSGTVTGESAASVLAFALILGVIWGGGKYAAVRIGAKSRASIVGPFDRVLGAGFGLLKSLLIVATGFMLITLVYDVIFGRDAERAEWMTDSRTYPLLSATGSAISDVVAARLAAGAATPTPPDAGETATGAAPAQQ